MDGKVISDGPTQVQVSDVPAAVSPAPVYTSEKIVRMSLSGVAAGTIVDMSFTLDDDRPPMPGDFLDGLDRDASTRVERERLELDVPSTLTPHIHEQNIDFKRVTSTRRGTNALRVGTERGTSDAWRAVRGGLEWRGDARSCRWQHRMERCRPRGMQRSRAGRYTATPSLSRIVDSLVKNAKTRDDSIRAVHRWVAAGHSLRGDRARAWAATSRGCPTR